MKAFSIYQSTIGLDEPCFIIAEAGSNHNGNLEMAKSLIQAACDAGADAVKFQTFKANRLYPKSAGKSDYLGSEQSIYDIIKAMEMPEEWLAELSDLTHQLGMAFISSPFHEEAVDLLAPYVDAFKIASYELTHEPLLRAIARYNKPVIMSTGASQLIEVKEAVELLRNLGVDDLVVLQCTACYPAPPASAQVSSLVHIRDTLGVLTGLSDHTEDPCVAPMVATALGAVVIEKHYTLSKRLPGPDHPFAVTAEGLSDLVQGVRRVEEVRGKGYKFVHPVEGELRDFARRSIFTTQPIKKGSRFTADHVDVLRQGKLGQGLAPSALPWVYQATACRDIPAEIPLQAEDLQGLDTALPAVGQWDPLLLRTAQMEDVGLVWVWANEMYTRASSLQSRPIPYPTHHAWFTQRIEQQHHHPHGMVQSWIVTQDQNPVAFVRLDPVSEAQYKDFMHADTLQSPSESMSNLVASQHVALVSIHVAHQSRGRGVARGSLSLLQNWAQQHPQLTVIYAEIHTSNHKSQSLFQQAGYQMLHAPHPDRIWMKLEVHS